MDELLTMLRPYLKYMDSSAELTIDEDLASAGLDSMGAIDLLLEVEERFNISIPDDLLIDETFATANALWDVISDLTVRDK